MVSFSVRFPEELYAAIKDSARDNRRSIQSEILYALELYVESKKKVGKSKEKPQE